MFKIKSAEEILASLRAIDISLSKLKISSIEINKAQSSITYNFICDKAVDEIIKSAILREVEKHTSPFFSLVKVTVRKIVCDSELINKEIFDYLSVKTPSISVFLKTTDIMSAVVGDVVKYTLRLTKDGIEYVTKTGLLRKLNEHLSHKFCADFVGNTDQKELEETISLLDEQVYETELERINYRTIKVSDVVVIDDITMGDTAVYIEDAKSGNLTVCGKITQIYEKTTEKGKPFFVIHLDDQTGTLSGLYFSRKNTYESIRRLAVEDEIIVSGTMGEWKGKPSFTMQKINRCTLPKDFVKKERFKKETPKNYKLIFPEPASTVKVSSVFDDRNALPEELTSKTYVVFDVETTGTDVMNEGITEIGAVKIVNGKIVEQFTSLIKPDYPISAEITALTGIDENLVKDSPKISAVMPDFIKFIDGATLVAHNAEFDTKFLKRFATAEDYAITNPVIDTLEMARKYLPQLKKHKLNVIADYFGIIFHHHRALSDAYATAEVFIELMKIKHRT
ncbi:MAG: 3'-5' exoribonuclease [Clostridia bacterium]|nr:3'-5' exoribonuclease [Clostridia bacterium]